MENVREAMDGNLDFLDNILLGEDLEGIVMSEDIGATTSTTQDESTPSASVTVRGANVRYTKDTTFENDEEMTKYLTNEYLEGQALKRGAVKQTAKGKLTLLF
jgi:hypothetical protein